MIRALGLVVVLLCADVGSRHGRITGGAGSRADVHWQASSRDQLRQLPARHVRSERHGARGPAPDLARELGRRLGVPVEFVQFDTAGKLADGVKTGMWDVAFLGAEPLRANEIAFTAAYLEIPSTYLVPAGSPIRSIADVDRAGVRIAVSERSAYELYLTRTIKNAKLVVPPRHRWLVRALRVPEARGAGRAQAEALDGRPEAPGSRVLDGQFTGVRPAIGTPKSRAAAAEYLRQFVEDVKTSGFVAEAIAKNGVEGVSVAPPARPVARSPSE